MEAAQILLQNGLILGGVALSGVLSRRIGVSAIPAYIVLGLLLAPIVGHSELVEVLALWGVVLLLFFIGLEFSFGALARGRLRFVRLGGRDLILNFPVGFIAGLLLGWGVLGGLLLGSALYISSSAIVAKSLIELRRTANPETEAILNILVFEDLAVAVLLALLSGVALGSGGVAGAFAGVGRALAFLAVIAMIARFGRSLLERVLDAQDDDVFLMLLGAAVLVLAGGAALAGVSEAIGAFLAGSLIAETRHKARAEHVFAPLQGLFAALFFFSFGLSVQLGDVPGILLPAALIAIAAIPTKVLAGFWSGRAEGLGRRASAILGITLIPRGEFSIVLAAVAVSAGYEEAAALITVTVLLLALIGTLGIRHAPALAAFVREPAPD